MTTETDYKALQSKYKALLNASKDGRQIMLINEYKKTISELRERTAKAEAHVETLKKSVELWKGKYKKLRARILSTTKGI